MRLRVLNDIVSKKRQAKILAAITAKNWGECNESGGENNGKMVNLKLPLLALYLKIES